MQTLISNRDTLIDGKYNEAFEQMCETFVSLGTIVYNGEIQTDDGKNRAYRLKLQFVEQFRFLISDPNIASLRLDNVGLLAEQNLSGESSWTIIKYVYNLINSYFDKINNVTVNTNGDIALEFISITFWDQLGKMFAIDNLTIHNCYQSFASVDLSILKSETLTKILKRLEYFIKSKESSDGDLNEFVKFIIDKIKAYYKGQKESQNKDNILLKKLNALWSEIGKMFGIANLSKDNFEATFKNFSFDNYSKKKLTSVLDKLNIFLQEKRSDDQTLNDFIVLLIGKVSQALSRKLSPPLTSNVKEIIDIKSILTEIGSMFGAVDLDLNNCYQLFEEFDLSTYSNRVLLRVIYRLTQISKSFEATSNKIDSLLIDEHEELKLFVVYLIEQITEYLDDANGEDSVSVSILNKEKKARILKKIFFDGFPFFQEFVEWALNYMKTNIDLSDVASLDDLQIDETKYVNFLQFKAAVGDKFEELIYKKYKDLFEESEEMESRDYAYLLSQIASLNDVYNSSNVSEKAIFFSLKRGVYLGDIYEFFNKIQAELFQDLGSKLDGLLLQGFTKYNSLE